MIPLNNIPIFPIFIIRSNCLFLTGNVYFDVRSRGDRYGKLTSIYPESQEEFGMLLTVTDLCTSLFILLTIHISSLRF